MRIALVYDCLYPHTVGGAERWLRALAVALSEDHEVTYVTRRQWRRGEDPGLEGIRCVAVSSGGSLYTADGRRRLLPAIRFGMGVFAHFLRRRNRYDIVHCLSYPFVPLVAIRAALAVRRATPLVYCEWLECLTDGYWRTYGGAFGGRVGILLQRLCIRLTPTAFAFSRHTCRRLRESGFRREVHLLGGLAATPERTPGAGGPAKRRELVLFAGRHVQDKGVGILPAALALVRESRPAVRAVLVGDGPERAAVVLDIGRLGLEDFVKAPGFVESAELERLMNEAACLVSPSIRDGYGMVVAEAAGAGLPVVVCRAPDNAAVERVEEGVNGSVAASSSPRDVAAAIVRVLEQGEGLRRRTVGWFSEHRDELSMSRSIARVRDIYGSDSGSESPAPAAPATSAS